MHIVKFHIFGLCSPDPLLDAEGLPFENKELGY